VVRAKRALIGAPRIASRVRGARRRGDARAAQPASRHSLPAWPYPRASGVAPAVPPPFALSQCHSPPSTSFDRVNPLSNVKRTHKSCAPGRGNGAASAPRGGSISHPAPSRPSPDSLSFPPLHRHFLIFSGERVEHQPRRGRSWQRSASSEGDLRTPRAGSGHEAAGYRVSPESNVMVARTTPPRRPNRESP